jgi:hypothetical protein
MPYGMPQLVIGAILIALGSGIVVAAARMVGGTVGARFGAIGVGTAIFAGGFFTLMSGPFGRELTGATVGAVVVALALGVIAGAWYGSTTGKKA